MFTKGDRSVKLKFLLLFLIIVWLFSGCAAKESSIHEPADTEASVTKTAPAATVENTGAQVTMPDGQPLDAYMASVEEQVKSVRDALENDVLTQPELNQKSQQLYELWDGALNELWAVIKNTLPEDEYLKLLEEQQRWIIEKEEAVKMAGEDYEAGSVYPLIVNTEAAKITEERVYELFALLE